jgi:hypothetical protein
LSDVQTEFLDIKMPVFLVDEPLKALKPHNPPTPEGSRKSASPGRSRKAPAHTLNRNSSAASIPPAQSASSFPALDYTTITKNLRNDEAEDPLADTVYFAQHRRAERKEKQLRNIEKDRAMHEKAQLERLLDGLQGPDWLKVMGITGVTDGERSWEPKRDYFIKEVQALVDKFRLWKEQEKKQRAEKEAAHAKEEEEEEESASGAYNEVRLHRLQELTLPTIEPEPHKSIPKNRSSHSHHKEPETPKPRRPPRPHGFFLPAAPVEPQAPFTSFYSKPHLRQASLGKHRHGRNATAFGHPIPELDRRVFELPEDFVTPEFLRDNARKRRRRKRESGISQ